MGSLQWHVAVRDTDTKVKKKTQTDYCQVGKRETSDIWTRKSYLTITKRMEKEHQHNSFPEMFQGANQKSVIPPPGVLCFLQTWRWIKVNKQLFKTRPSVLDKTLDYWSAIRLFPGLSSVHSSVQRAKRRKHLTIITVWMPHTSIITVRVYIQAVSTEPLGYLRSKISTVAFLFLYTNISFQSYVNNS